MIACFFANLPSWIQALVAVGALILAAWSLIVLRDYAADTKKIANASVSQTENSQKPFLAVIMREHLQDNPGGWGIENQGFGPAINVRYSGHVRGNPAIATATEPITLGKTVPLHQDIADAFNSNQVFVLEYESLSGVRYRTRVEMVENEMRTTFQKHLGIG